VRRPFSVQVFLYRREREVEFLLFKRRPRPDLDLPGFWQGVSGALLDGESFIAAAIREVAEETGIAITAPTATGHSVEYPIKAEWRPHYGPGPSRVEEDVYCAQIASDTQITLSLEHDECAWCDASSALDRLTFGQNRAALQSVLRALK
jgi:dihydroneopterin triphosphate diphosphatase